MGGTRGPQPTSGRYFAPDLGALGLHRQARPCRAVANLRERVVYHAWQPRPARAGEGGRAGLLIEQPAQVQGRLAQAVRGSIHGGVEVGGAWASSLYWVCST